MISWIKYNPSKEISKLTIPVLILQGDRDIQVSIEDANKLKSSYPNSSLKILEGTNHVLKIVKNMTENQNSYNDASFILNPELSKYIENFVNSTTQKVRK